MKFVLLLRVSSDRSMTMELSSLFTKPLCFMKIICIPEDGISYSKNTVLMIAFTQARSA